MKQILTLSLRELLKKLESRELTPSKVLGSYLERITSRNDEIGAFVNFDKKKIISSIEILEKKRVNSCALWGMPFAAKDVLDTVELPTEYGSPIYIGNRPKADASVIASVLSKGAVLLGKTVTCEFATTTPSHTKNPLNVKHTPGGSSSGSAAAVADFMTPIAYSTQTAGSTIRPAVYCGVSGFKPTYNAISTAGLKTLSPSADTIGIIAKTVDDISLLFHEMKGMKESSDIPLHNIKAKVIKSSQWDYVTTETANIIDNFINEISKSGVFIENLNISPRMEKFHKLQGELTFYEIRDSLAYERFNFMNKLSKSLQSRFTEPFDMSYQTYVELIFEAEKLRFEVDELFNDADVLIYPAAEGEADFGTSYTGSHRFCGFWTLMHTPTISFPLGKGLNALPIGVQLIGKRGDDSKLLSIANALSQLSTYKLINYLNM